MFLIITVLLFAAAIAIYIYQSNAMHIRRYLCSTVADSDKCESRGISIIATQIESIEQICSLLSHRTNLYEVVAIDNFDNREELLSSIIQHFSLIRVNFIPSKEIPQNAIKGLYRSHKRLFARLIIIECDHPRAVTPSQIAASLSSYDFTLELPHRKILRQGAIEMLLVEISRRNPDDIDEMKSVIGERFKLLRREWAVAERFASQNIAKSNRVLIPYKILKNERENNSRIFRFHKK